MQNIINNTQIKMDEIHAYVDPKVAYYKKLRGGIEIVDAIPKSAAGKVSKYNI
jgi:hypothetical protein